MATMLTATAGYIPNIAGDSKPGVLSTMDRQYLRELAYKVKDLTENPQQKEKRSLWYKHNRMENGRPMLLVFHEDSWIDIISEDMLRLNDPFWKQWEWYLRHLLYRSQKIPDDFVIEPDIYVNSVVHLGGWGMEATYSRTGDDGSYIWDAPLKELPDIKKLKYPTIEIDEKATKTNVDAVGEMLGDILHVHRQCGVRVDANIIGQVTYLRGIEQVMLDIYDEPEWLHELMEFVTEGTLRLVKYLEENGQLNLNNRNHYTDSGGIGYSNELPSNNFDGGHVRTCDMWGFGVAQEFSEVSPRHHEEFLLNYQMRILKNYGLVAYGCCEPYSHKFDMLIKKIPQLRRVSVSPWCDMDRAADKLKDKYILSWKPNPALIAQEYNPHHIRKYIRENLERTRGCVIEVILKDLFTIQKEPQRVETWVRIAREEIERIS